MAEVNELVSEELMAERLGYSRQWLRNCRLNGDGPVYVKLGNRIMYDPQDVQAWITGQKRDPKDTVTKDEE